MSLFGAAALQVALDYAKAEGIVKEHDCVVVCQGSSPTLLQLMLDLTEAYFSVEICIFLVMSFFIAFMGTDAFKRVNSVQFSVLSLRM
jgi:hypothetical protein